jgi:hypothetical protein
MQCECRHDAGHGQLKVSVRFDRADVQITRTPFGVVVALAGAKTGGPDGGPALPRTVIKVAVPPLQWPARVSVERETFVPLTQRPTFVAPVQRLRPGVSGKSPDQAADTEVAAQPGRIKPSTCRPCPDPERGQSEFPEPFDAPPIVPPDPRLYAEAVRSPRPVAAPLTIEQIGLVRIAQIELNPIRLTPEGHLELCTSCDVVVSYTDQEPLADRALSHRALEARLGREIDPDLLAPLPGPTVTSRAQAKRLTDIARAEVINPDLVWEYGRHWTDIYLATEYLIVTDDCEWNPETMMPSAARPGLVAAFKRLAQWKSSRGVRARVVTISEILSGQFGDCRTGARDLQEVIRRFLKLVVPQWGVSWLLLGGDIDVVPIRRAAGAVEGHMAVGADDPPKDNVSFWTGTFLKMNAAAPGTWWMAGAANVLMRADNGRVIPYDAAGTSNATTPGWFFTTSNSYATRTTAATSFVRVNGPAAVVNTTLQWLYNWNTIPTDFYYASLNSFVISDISIATPLGTFTLPWVYFPEHDWDADGNGVYGQHTSGGDMDGVVMATDVSVGRAPVATADQANAFVDKVKRYEGFSAPFAVPLHASTWPRRVVLAASNWGGPLALSSTAAMPPAENRYHHPAGAAHSIIKLETAPSSFQQALITEISDTDRRIVPYLETAGPGGRGWHFAKSATDLGVSELLIPLPFPFSFTLRFPIPSQWIVVFAPLVELTPVRFLIDHPAQDSSMADQEALREQLQAELPIYNTFTRLYEDDLDLTPGQAAAAPVQYLTAARLRAALEASPHIVSLSGHGNSDGCCTAGVWMAAGLTNEMPFIGYADSCLTNQVDADDAFSEALVYNPSGGAAAYVGNTRFSWIGVGDNFQRAFFHRLTATRHLGLLNDSRVGLYGTTGANTVYDRWAVFALNLTGDPEMQVHKKSGRRLDITIDGVAGRKPFVVKIVEVKPPKPVPDPWPFAETFVHVRQGERVFTTTTDARGEARLDLSTFALGEVEVTVSHQEALPRQVRMRLTGPAWVEGLVLEVSHREGGDRTAVRLRTAEGEREFFALGERPDYRLILDALENAFVAKESIALLVDSVEDGGAIERFRFRRQEDAGGSGASGRSA